MQYLFICHRGSAFLSLPQRRKPQYAASNLETANGGAIRRLKDSLNSFAALLFSERIRKASKGGTTEKKISRITRLQCFPCSRRVGGRTRKWLRGCDFPSNYFIVFQLFGKKCPLSNRRLRQHSPSPSYWLSMQAFKVRINNCVLVRMSLCYMYVV